VAGDDGRMSIRTEQIDRCLVVTIDRPERRNAVDRATAQRLYEAFASFDGDPSVDVAVLTGAAGTFCAGADLLAIADGEPNDVRATARMVGTLAPMGPTRLQLAKPVIAAVEGYAVAGGLELALWCDLRVAAQDAVFGVFSRRFGVPLIDGGTIRLPRLIGHSRAMDLILTGRAVSAPEAFDIGLVHRLVPPDSALTAALELAAALATSPQQCLREDLASAREQWDLQIDAALYRETAGGRAVLESGESQAGAKRFARGTGRHGDGLPGRA
jgi:enoyl-CoA hydratase